MKNTCLICRDLTSPKAIGVGKVPDWSKSCVQRELSVVLLLRKILGISQAQIISLLQNYGNPSSWGINLCSPCNRVFIEAEFIHDRLRKLHAEFDELAGNLQKYLRDSGSSTLCPVPTVPAPGTAQEGRRTRKRDTKTNTSSSSVSECPENLDTLDPSEFIRQEVLKGLGERKDVVLPTPIDSLGITITDVFSRIVKVEPTTYSLNEDNSSEIKDLIKLTTPGRVEQTHSENEHNDDFDDGNDEYFPDADGNEDNDDNENGEGNDEDEAKQSKVEANSKSKGTEVGVTPFSCPQPVKLEKGFKCPICGRKALSKCSSLGHIMRAHYNDGKPYHCHLCRFRFKRDVHLRQHLEDEHNCSTTPLDDPDELQQGDLSSFNIPAIKINTRKFECDICPKTKYKVLYQSLETLEAHKKIKHLGVKRPYTCKHCDKSFKLYTQLRHHMYAHQRLEKEKLAKAKDRLHCNQCNRSFKSIGSVKAHLRTKGHLQSQEYPFQCELCPKGFFQKPSLENHRAQEHYEQLDIQPFKCSYCGNVLCGQRALDHHIRIRHTKETIYKCEPCNLGFMFTHTYNRHMEVVHAKEKPLLCSYCPKRFASKSHFETHLRVHTGEKPYKCPHCNKEYSDRPTYRRHLETHGDQVYQCNICENRYFKVWHSYRLHMKTHNQNVSKTSPNVTGDDDPIAIKTDNNQSEMLNCGAVENQMDLNNLTVNYNEEVSSDSIIHSTE